MRVTAALLLSFALTLAACNRNKTSQTDSGATVEETGEELSKNPFKAMKQIGEAGQKLAEKAEELEKRKPVDPVKYDLMLPLLPAPDGWTAHEAKGETAAMGEWKISTVSRRYEKGEGEARQNMKIEIIDGSYVPMIYMPFTAMTSFATESTEGHKKGVTIDGFPAFEEWTKKSKEAKLTALVEDRFLVTVDGDNVDPETVREWIGLVDLKKVAELQ